MNIFFVKTNTNILLFKRMNTCKHYGICAKEIAKDKKYKHLPIKEVCDKNYGFAIGNIKKIFVMLIKGIK